MAEHFRFFDSEEGDIRDYRASQYAEFYARFLSDGLYTENGKAGLQVTPGEGLQVQVAAGYAFVRGYMYHNDAAMAFNLAPADNVLNRLDRVVLRFDEVAREIRLVIKTGAFASTPTAPTLENTATVKELGLAQVYVKSKATSIATSNITDERLTAACGLVSSLITIPVQEMWDVWNQTMTDIETAWAQRSAGIDADWDVLKAAWQAWFDSVQNDLGVRVMIGATEPLGLAAGDLWFKEV